MCKLNTFPTTLCWKRQEILTQHSNPMQVITSSISISLLKKMSNTYNMFSALETGNFPVINKFILLI